MLFTEFQKIAKKFVNVRSYSPVFKVASDRSLIYSDGFMLIRAILRHDFDLDACFNIVTGMKSNVEFPNCESIFATCKDESTREIFSILDTAKAIKPKSKKTVFIDIAGNITAGPGINLLYANLAHDLGCTACYRDSSGMFHFIGVGVELWVAECNPTK